MVTVSLLPGTISLRLMKYNGGISCSLFSSAVFSSAFFSTFSSSDKNKTKIHVFYVFHSGIRQIKIIINWEAFWCIATEGLQGSMDTQSD